MTQVFALSLINLKTRKKNLKEEIFEEFLHNWRIIHFHESRIEIPFYSIVSTPSIEVSRDGNSIDGSKI